MLKSKSTEFYLSCEQFYMSYLETFWGKILHILFYHPLSRQLNAVKRCYTLMNPWKSLENQPFDPLESKIKLPSFKPYIFLVVLDNLPLTIFGNCATYTVSPNDDAETAWVGGQKPVLCDTACHYRMLCCKGTFGERVTFQVETEFYHANNPMS